MLKLLVGAFNQEKALVGAFSVIVKCFMLVSGCGVLQAAVLAVHLNMLEEAEQLLLGCGRHDLLNKLYQDR